MQESEDAQFPDLEEKVLNAGSSGERVEALADLAWNIKYVSPQRAVNLALEAIKLSMETGLEDSLPKSYLAKAMGLTQMSRFPEALASAESGLLAYRKTGNRQGILHALNVTGSVYSRWGKLSQAFEHYLEAMKIFVELHEQPDPGILSNIGGVYLQLGDTERALECYEQVKIMAEGVEGPADLKTAAYINMSEIYCHMGLHDFALESSMLALEMAEKNRMMQATAVVNDNIGSILTEMKRFVEARDYFDRSLEIFRIMNDMKGVALVLQHIGKSSFEEGREDALEPYEESLEIFRSLDDSIGVSDALIGVSEVLTRLGRREEALAHLSEALEISGLLGLKKQLSMVHLKLHDIFEKGGEFEKALMHIKLHYGIETQMKSEKIEKRIKHLRAVHQLEKAREDVFLYRQRMVELQQQRQSQDDEFPALDLTGFEMDVSPVLETDPESGLSYRSPDTFSTDKRVLIVEDDQKVAEFLINALESNGYPVLLSSSWRNAHSMVTDENDEIGCIFVDVRLPDGSGIDLIRQIRECDPDVPVLAGSGYPLSDEDSEYLRENRIVFIRKPYNIHTLILSLNTMYLPDIDFWEQL